MSNVDKWSSTLTGLLDSVVRERGVSLAKYRARLLGKPEPKGSDVTTTYKVIGEIVEIEVTWEEPTTDRCIAQQDPRDMFLRDLKQRLQDLKSGKLSNYEFYVRTRVRLDGLGLP